MKKTSVYLSDEERNCLREIAAREGRPQAAIVRDALAAYANGPAFSDVTCAESQTEPGESITTEWLELPDGTKYRIDRRADGSRYFATAGCVEGDGTSVADIPDDELMRGFGDDSFG